MNTIDQVYEWLYIAFIEPFGRINEIFYYDKAANEFFSIYMLDYFLTDPDSGGEVQNSPYSKEELAVLLARIDRCEANDPSILSVPQLTVEERKFMMQSFLNKEGLQHNATLQSFIETLQCNLRQELEDAKNGISRLDFGNELPEGYQDKWQAFKRLFVRSHIDNYCNLHNINLETVILFAE